MKMKIEEKIPSFFLGLFFYIMYRSLGDVIFVILLAVAITIPNFFILLLARKTFLKDQLSKYDINQLIQKSFIISIKAAVFTLILAIITVFFLWG